jgi:hypothetical protein
MNQQLPPHVHPDNLALKVSYFIGEHWQDEIQFLIGKAATFNETVYLSMQVDPTTANLSGVGRYCLNPIGGMGSIKSGHDLRRNEDIAACLNKVFSNRQEAVCKHNLTQIGVPVREKNQTAIYFSLCSAELYDRIIKMIQDV